MTRTEMRSIAATMQVLAAVRGETLPASPLSFDVLMATRCGPRDAIVNRRVVRHRPYDITGGRTAYHPPARPERARDRLV